MVGMKVSKIILNLSLLFVLIFFSNFQARTVRDVLKERSEQIQKYAQKKIKRAGVEVKTIKTKAGAVTKAVAAWKLSPLALIGCRRAKTCTLAQLEAIKKWGMALKVGAVIAAAATAAGITAAVIGRPDEVDRLAAQYKLSSPSEKVLLIQLASLRYALKLKKTGEVDLFLDMIRREINSPSLKLESLRAAQKMIEGWESTVKEVPSVLALLTDIKILINFWETSGAIPKIPFPEPPKLVTPSVETMLKKEAIQRYRISAQLDLNFLKTVLKTPVNKVNVREGARFASDNAKKAARYILEEKGMSETEIANIIEGEKREKELPSKMKQKVVIPEPIITSPRVVPPPTIPKPITSPQPRTGKVTDG